MGLLDFQSTLLTFWETLSNFSLRLLFAGKYIYIFANMYTYLNFCNKHFLYWTVFLVFLYILSVELFKILKQMLFFFSKIFCQNHAKPGTALIETTLRGESLYLVSFVKRLHNTDYFLILSQKVSQLDKKKLDLRLDWIAFWR